MSITVEGINVRIKEVSKDFKVKFESLTESGQKRLFKENKDIFFFDALTSKYVSVRRLALMQKNDCSSVSLNKAIKLLVKKKSAFNVDLIIQLLNIPNLDLDDELRKSLAHSDYWQLRLWIANDKNTPLQILKEMLWGATTIFVGYDSSTEMDVIITNPNFELDEEVEEIIKRFNPTEFSKIESRIKELTSW